MSCQFFKVIDSAYDSCAKRGWGIHDFDLIRGFYLKPFESQDLLQNSLVKPNG